MWKSDKQSISAGDESTNVIAGRDINLFINCNIPTNLVDQKIEEETKKLRKSRFYSEFDGIRMALNFGGHLVNGDLSGGSNEVRGRALAWCARLLSCSENLDRAQEFLAQAKMLGDFSEARIVESFCLSHKGDKAAALNTLADINSNASRSAAFMIVAHHDGAEGALSWMNDTGYTVRDLDSDGKSFLLSHQLQLGRWSEVAQTISVLSKADFGETPILHHLAALATLISTVPKDLRTIVLTQAPFDAQELRFPLASDAVAMEARCAAHQHFLDAVEAAKQLACPRTAEEHDKYALWLELRNPAQSAHGKNRLENKLRDPNTALGYVHYAFQFGIKLDIDAVEQDIQRNIARNGGMTVDSATARFALAFTQPTPEEVADYITRHYTQLAAHIDPKNMQFLQVEMLSRAGLIKSAYEVLDQLLEAGIPAEQESNLRRIIAEAEGSDPIESRKAQYETTGTLGDLINLVAELEGHQRWDDLCKFSRRLFEETHSLSDAERLVDALNQTYRTEELVKFLNENASLRSQSRQLRMSYAWALYYEGALLESRTALSELSDDVNSQNYRALQVNLGVATGDWASISAYLVDEYRNRNDRNAHELISAAQLALHVGFPQAKELVVEAVAKANNDSAVLIAAYFIASNAGWEDDPEVFHWLEKAAELSGDDGPLRKTTLKGILDWKPEWDRRASETSRLLTQGQIPIFLAAQLLNRTLIDLTTFPALTNLAENDPRRRSVIPAYSGKRMPSEFTVSGKKAAALDATALLTLSFLGILDKSLDAFGTIFIPHSTLGWLFGERQKAEFHQPSRIVNAHELRDLMAADVVRRFTPSSAANSDLAAQIGDELAALIAEAGKVRDCKDTQHIVVRSAPVYRLFSLMEEEADLSAHADVLSSCLAVVEKLRQKGVITAIEEKRARAYLQLHEKPWTNQPSITDGATLYLDFLAISHFQHLGLLGKFKASGLTIVASLTALSEADALIAYERTSVEVKEVIEGIRASLNSRIESGQVQVGRSRNFDEYEEKSISEHPSLGILALVTHCDIAIIDDRFINQHVNIDNGGTKTPVLSTLDLLDALVAANALTDDEQLEYRTRLRKAGYFFVPVTVDELEQCLRETAISNGEVVETAELKAIRESVLRVRMSDWLQLPEETPWLDGTLKAFVYVLRNLWVDGVDIDEATARSNYLVEQTDIRGWAHSFVPANADSIVRIGRAVFIILLLTPPINVQRKVVEAYWNWVEEKVLIPIQEQFPEVYERLVDMLRHHVSEMTKTLLLEGDNS